jgi:PIN domain nuclease of toxin-antitoxin system
MALDDGVSLYIVDTHALFWYLTASPRLGTQAKVAFDEGSKGQAVIYVHVIVLAELYFLNEKVGRPLNFVSEFQRLQQSGQFVFTAFQPQDILDFEDNRSIPEMHDRIIVGAARRLNAVCISRDEVVTQSGLVATIWE